MKTKDLLVAALQNGSVIDHIPCDHLFTIARLLNLEQSNKPITIGNNLTSKKMGRKGIIKVADKYFSDKELSRLAVLCPDMQLTVIHDYEVTEKRQIALPSQLTDVVQCENPVCITNNEPMHTIFNVDPANQTLRCHYCGHTQRIGHIKLKN